MCPWSPPAALRKAPLPHSSAGAVALGVGEDLIPRQALRFREGAWIRELAARFLNFVRQARAEMK